MVKPSNPITWQGLADMVKRMAAIFASVGILAGGWVAMGGPIPATHAELEHVSTTLDAQDQQLEQFAKDTRILLLMMQKNMALAQLAELRDREQAGEYSPDIRKMKLSFEKEIARIDRQLAALGYAAF